MGQANRRSNTNTPSKVSSLTEKWHQWKIETCQRWQRFPRFHRWALMILLPLFVLVLLIPTPQEGERTEDSDPTVRRDIPLNLGSGTVTSERKTTAVGQRTDIVLNIEDQREDQEMGAQGGKTDNGPAPEKKPMTSRIYPLNGGKVYTLDLETNKPLADKGQTKALTSQSVKTSSTPSGTPGQWVSYKVPAGKTLTSVFRDRNLPLSDLFAIAKVEGAGKPISNVQSGQVVTYRQNNNGQIDGLKVEGNGISAVYYRRGNGAYYRQ